LYSGLVARAARSVTRILTALSSPAGRMRKKRHGPPLPTLVLDGVRSDFVPHAPQNISSGSEQDADAFFPASTDEADTVFH
jgi:hypothetical protein